VVTALPVMPALVEGVVSHQRVGAVRHGFRHRAYQWLVDLDDLPRLPIWLRPFAAFRSVDHLGDPGRSIKDNVVTLLAEHGVDISGGRVLMLANARVLGHVFNPLSVFWCYDSAGQLVRLVAEVHNTYGERHAYVLRPDESGAAVAAKTLYVSPFFDVSGDYSLRFGLTADQVACQITLRRDGQVAFSASFRGHPRRATSRQLLRTVARHPLMPQRVSGLIRLHGVWLWLRRLPVQRRPAHPHPVGG
jgi:DUF1365 family protein